MGYIEDIFYRANLQQIRAFLMDGTEALYVDSEDYKGRLDKAFSGYKKILLKYIPNLEDESELISEFALALSAAEEVYMEIGIKVGFKLHGDMMNEDLKLHF